MTVSGLTIANADREPLQTLHSQAQKIQPAAASFGGFLAEHRGTPIRRRRARFSS
ncbi:MAG: hypothetical protein Q8N47_11560 [Bryobacterales bacterium]|nr:hypothetical protein [Bryobacterales bacterium]